jgi:hypothetical protein
MASVKRAAVAALFAAALGRIKVAADNRLGGHAMATPMILEIFTDYV